MRHAQVLAGCVRPDTALETQPRDTGRETQFLPAAIQKPSIPIWVGGYWPHKKPFRRAAKFQGIFPLKANSYEPLHPKDYQNILAYMKKYQPQPNQPFDAVFHTYFKTWDKFDDMIRDYSSAGVNWFVECIHPWREDIDSLTQLVQDLPKKHF